MALSPRIHPTAIVAAEAELADDVEVGAHCIVEGKVKVGPGCVLRHGCYLYGPLTMGQGNTVFSGAVLGEKPQHLKYNDEPTSLEIGDGNIVREFVTIHRGTAHSHKTVIGSHNYFMVNCHIGHDCVIGNRNVFANGALVAGHCVVEDNVYLSGNCAIHQFVRIGRLALMSGCGITTKDMPPFIMQQGVDNVVGLNLVGMRRAGLKPAEINGVRQAFRILFREGHPLPYAIAKIDKELGHIDTVQEMLIFLRKPGHGICPMRDRSGPDRHHHEEAA
jgi:UDP-N-acetylglucosamine acyltransferase